MSPRHNAWRGIALVCLTVLLFSFMETLVKYLSRFYPPPMLVWARYSVHAVLAILLIAPHVGRDGMLRTRQPGAHLLRGIALVVSTLFFFSGLKFLPQAVCSAIGFAFPLLVTALSVYWLNEHVTWSRWLAVLCGFAGVLAIIRPGGEAYTHAALLPLCSALCYAVYQIMTRQMSKTENAHTMLFYPALVGALGLLVVLPFNWVVPGLHHIPLIVAVGAIGATGHFLLIRALRVAPASLLAPFSYTQLLWVGLLGWLVFGDVPDAWSLTGMATVVASGIFVGIMETRERTLRVAS
jgi:drug/metabolite transporter (DMT)-like permease